MAAQPPSAQEVQRKLSLCTPPKQVAATTTHVLGPAGKDRILPISKGKGENILTSAGPESDSDLASQPFGVPPSSPNKSLFPIAERERRALSGDDSEEEEEDDDGEGGWRTADVPRALRGTADETIIKTGYLWKKGERRKTWKKRWFVLRPAHFAFYKSSAEYKLLKILDLSEVHSVSAVELKRHSNAFSLVSPFRTFYLQAETASEVDSWVVAIQNTKDNLMATSTITPAETPNPIEHATQPVPIPVAPRSRDRNTSASTTSPGSRYLTSSDSEEASPRQTSLLSPPRSLAVESVTGSPSIFTVPGSVTSPAETKVIVSGYLTKCGAKRHIWRKRWFILSNDRLEYSTSHMDTRSTRQFALSSIVDALEFHPPEKSPSSHSHQSASVTHGPLSPSQSLSSALDDMPKNAHTFKIVTTKRTLLLCAPSEEEEIRWLSAITALKARKSSGASKGSVQGTPAVPSRTVPTIGISSPTPVSSPASRTEIFSTGFERVGGSGPSPNQSHAQNQMKMKGGATVSVDA